MPRIERFVKEAATTNATFAVSACPWVSSSPAAGGAWSASLPDASSPSACRWGGGGRHPRVVLELPLSGGPETHRQNDDGSRDKLPQCHQKEPDDADDSCGDQEDRAAGGHL